MRCNFCDASVTAADEFCTECGRHIVFSPQLAQPKPQSGEPVAASKAGGDDQVAREWYYPLSKQALNAAIVIAGLLIGLVIVTTAENPKAVTPEPTATQTLDPVKACAIFTQGYEAAMAEGGSEYGMSLWRQAAAEAAKMADGRLYIELNNFAQGASGADIVVNIAELCN